jgi:hypothetical protein
MALNPLAWNFEKYRLKSKSWQAVIIRRTWFSQDQRTNRQGREDREEKTRILASFALKK